MRKSYLLLLLLLLFWGCAKQKPTPINSELKKSFNYQVGSYWIYRDSVSGATDSFFVTSNKPSVSEYSLLTANGNSANEITIEISDYTNGIINSDSSYWFFDLSANLLFVGEDNLKSYINILYDPLIEVPFSDNPSNYSYGTDGVNFLGIIPSFQLNGKAYLNTAQVWHSDGVKDSTNAGFYNDMFYINETDGIIKMSLHHGVSLRVLELQRDNIVR
jgi:hypothetical protein